MEFSDLKDEIETILINNRGTYVLAYQIYKELEKINKMKWDKLNQTYTNNVGVGAGSYHTPVAHIADALSYFTRNKEIEGLEQADFCKNGIKVYDIQPSPSQITLGIWRIKK